MMTMGRLVWRGMPRRPKGPPVMSRFKIAMRTISPKPKVAMAK